jgi:YD repeat-containing protein
VTGNHVFLGELQASESQSAPWVPYTVVTRCTYTTPATTTTGIIGDLAGTTEEWVDNSGNVQGKAVTTSYTYDANGNRLTETRTRTTSGGAAEVITTRYYYDALNRVVTNVVSATIGGAASLAPQTNIMTYNALGKQATSTDAAGRVTSSVYDFAGNLIETDYPDGTVSRTSYDGFGRQQYVQDRAMTNAAGNSTAPATLSTYDASGRVIMSQKFAGVTLTCTAAGSGDYTAMAGSPAEVKMVATPPGVPALTTSLTFYDAVGNGQYSVSPLGLVTQNQYDANNRRTNVLVYQTYNYWTTQGNGTPSPTGAALSTGYGYDGNGNQTTVTDAAGHTTTSVYDAANQLVEVQEPATGNLLRQTVYDGLGRKLQDADEAGVNTAYSYDFRGLLTSVTLAAGSTQQVTTVYQYDELGNETAQMDAAGRTTKFQYDALGRRIGRTLPGGQTESFVYDLKGNLVCQTNFNGVVITNQYDVVNRLTNCASLTGGYQVGYAYNPTNGLRTMMVDAGGTNVYQYDVVGELTNKTVMYANGPKLALNYAYSTNGTLTALWSGSANGVTNAFQYDLLGRLTNVVANGGTERLPRAQR